MTAMVDGGGRLRGWNFLVRTPEAIHGSLF